MIKKGNNKLIYFLLLFLLACADEPTHSNVFDPDTPNNPPSAVELRTDLVTDMTNHSISFDWTESGDDDFFNYNIYRSDQPGVDTLSTLIGTHPYPFLNTITDTGLQQNRSYCYNVYTEDKGGLITASNELCVTSVPDIYYCGRLSLEGSGTDYLYHFSKMDVVTHDNTSNECYAILESNWDLYFYAGAYDPDDPSGCRIEIIWTNIIGGDSDNDGAPDLYEIYGEADPYDADNYPSVDVNIYPHITPTKVVVFKDDNSSSTTLLVLLRGGEPYYDSKIIKFTGDWDEGEFYLDTSWYDNGVFRTSRNTAIARSSSDILIVGEGWGYRTFDLSGNELSFVEVPEVYIGVISVGKDSPTGSNKIYLTNWNGTIFKYESDGNFLTSWQGFDWNSGSLVPIGLFADNRGNVFISDTELGTVNRYNSEGILVSRWDGINQEFVYPFYFSEQVAIYSQASLIGDNNNNLFIVDMHTYRSRAAY